MDKLDNLLNKISSIDRNDFYVNHRERLIKVVYTSKDPDLYAQLKNKFIFDTYKLLDEETYYDFDQKCKCVRKIDLYGNKTSEGTPI